MNQGRLKSRARDRLTPCEAIVREHLLTQEKSEHYKLEIDRHFARFEDRLPSRPAKFVGWLRKPSSRYVRIPLAILLVFGGILSFLPVLSLWMLPLGLLLFAQDVPFLQKPLARMLGWIERKWIERQRAKDMH
jgi:hypothetical protein